MRRGRKEQEWQLINHPLVVTALPGQNKFGVFVMIMNMIMPFVVEILNVFYMKSAQGTFLAYTKYLDRFVI